MQSKRIFVSLNFANMMDQFIKQFKKEHGVDLTTTQATDLLYKKIDNAGGLII
jgi:hypothetical protein